MSDEKRKIYVTKDAPLEFKIRQVLSKLFFEKSTNMEFKEQVDYIAPRLMEVMHNDIRSYRLKLEEIDDLYIKLAFMDWLNDLFKQQNDEVEYTR